MVDFYEVGREKIREYALAVGYLHPACWDEAAARELGYPALLAPVSFASSVGMLPHRRRVREALGAYQTCQLLHLAQEIQVHSPTLAGARLTCEVSTPSARAIPEGELIILTTTIGTVEGHPVQTVHTTLLARPDPGDLVATARRLAMPDLALPVPAHPEGGQPCAPARPHPYPAGKAVAGASFPVQVVSVTRGHLVNYAGVSGDNNPIHWDDDVARAAGLESVVAHGLLTLGMAESYLAGCLGNPACVAELSVRFAHPLYLHHDPAQIRFTAAVRRVDPVGQTALVALDATTSGAPIFGQATARILLA